MSNSGNCGAEFHDPVDGAGAQVAGVLAHSLLRLQCIFYFFTLCI